jgi:hypothetical protein
VNATAATADECVAVYLLLKSMMSNMADNCKLCPATVSLLFDNIDKVLIIKNKSQQKALTEYNKINNKEISANEKELTAT